MSHVSVKHNSRLSDLVGYKLRVLTEDGRVYIGELMAFDKHMNVILSDCVEERIPKQEQLKLRQNKTIDEVKVEKRTLGLVILRGEHILTTVVQDKPLISKRERLVKEKQQQKVLKKQQNKNKKGSNDGKISKPNESKYKGKTSSGIPVQAKKFQPPPGFKAK
ncbi:similar to Saccharomyces cerevisiae YER029C SMB1 Core Sm protein Sm B [Maudiozyma barnettii]|uniref:Sm protein B n=1 Tax=Maudiozyma barnettii TaxID=61262 RepID=A0A8H2ZGR9_9SACH|nr:mRNA splicing protein SMB1 [Kazachstania barnettii]CAB4253025.1 similar to Saccharomyces cerevisiae YER029C SMB1 Core Sm protein Sm B [Kazachstania barnettii]CAD1780440.1 similar to Saccharomyces cerevisiae YER029C SMB1 Core Sm protein Sm B [Kazachstania barnettii]